MAGTFTMLDDLSGVVGTLAGIYDMLVKAGIIKVSEITPLPLPPPVTIKEPWYKSPYLPIAIAGVSGAGIYYIAKKKER